VARNATTHRRRAAAALGLIALAGAAHGCVSPSAPPAPPSGGHVLALSYPTFRDSISPILERQGCDAGGECHGGGIRGTLELSPTSAKNIPYDYDQVVLQVDPVERDSSAILTRPLVLDAGGTPHPFKPFASTADSDYATIHRWILAGVLQ